MSIKTLERLVICHIDCSIWSGRKKLRPEDLRLVNGSQLPSKDVASLGSKKICDPEALARFERLKKEAQRLCEQVGVRFLGGYAVPEQHTDSILAGLDKVSRAFAQCKQQFLADYDQVTLDWMDKHPEFAEAIRRAISPVDEVAARLQFDYALYRMQAAGDAGQLHSKVSGMGPHSAAGSGPRCQRVVRALGGGQAADQPACPESTATDAGQAGWPGFSGSQGTTHGAGD